MGLSALNGATIPDEMLRRGGRILVVLANRTRDLPLMLLHRGRYPNEDSWPECLRVLTPRQVWQASERAIEHPLVDEVPAEVTLHFLDTDRSIACGRGVRLYYFEAATAWTRLDPEKLRLFETEAGAYGVPPEPVTKHPKGGGDGVSDSDAQHG